MKLMRRTAMVFAILLFVYLTALAGFAFAMRQPFDRFSMLMAKVGPAPFLLFPFETLWKSARAGQLRPGDEAPDFMLPRVDHAASIRLSSLRGVRPVVLVFGSYT